MTIRPFCSDYQYTQDDRKILENYKHIVDAIGMVLGSTCEAVLHSFEDLSASVIHIHNGELTGRSVGSPVTDKALQILSDCEAHGFCHSDVYFTKNKNGHTMRSSSTIIKNPQGQIIGMLCINLDISVPLDVLMKAFLPPVDDHHDNETFAINVEDLIAGKTAEAKEQIFADDSVPPRQKVRKIVSLLKEQGIFKLREAVPKVAHTLGVSKDAVYLHLRQLKKEQGE